MLGGDIGVVGTGVDANGAAIAGVDDAGLSGLGLLLPLRLVKLLQREGMIKDRVYELGALLRYFSAKQKQDEGSSHWQC